mmetsp:Transcript_965/g.2947  ORF Transcript_965/g.2947 Transcript_965/m.2947 type:complete len:477 (-) Transcript_965:647-2077(-)
MLTLPGRGNISGQLFDWPLSHNEKKSRLLRLYDKDLQAADKLIRSGQAQIATLHALQGELEQAAHRNAVAAARSHGNCSRDCSQLGSGRGMNVECLQCCQPNCAVDASVQPDSGLPRGSPVASVACLGAQQWAASGLDVVPWRRSSVSDARCLSEAAERLKGAIESATSALSDLLGAVPVLQAADEEAGTRQRALSEGAGRNGAAPQGPPGVLRRGCQQRVKRSRARRVSFADQGKAGGLPPDAAARSSSPARPGRGEPEPPDPLTPERAPAWPVLSAVAGAPAAPERAEREPWLRPLPGAPLACAARAEIAGAREQLATPPRPLCAAAAGPRFFSIATPRTPEGGPDETAASGYRSLLSPQLAFASEPSESLTMPEDAVLAWSLSSGDSSSQLAGVSGSRDGTASGRASAVRYRGSSPTCTSTTVEHGLHAARGGPAAVRCLASTVKVPRQGAKGTLPPPPRPPPAAPGGIMDFI